MVKSKKQTLLEKLGTIVGEKSKIGKLISGYRKLEEANYISSHFSAYLAPVVASSKELKNDVFTIRHEVYCEELGFEPHYKVSNPAKWMAAANDTLQLVNFFESTNTSYEVNGQAK